MSQMNCPHCQSEKLGQARVPGGVVAVMPCPSCGGLVVRFRHKAIALDRDVLFQGSKDERKLHLADVISEFMDEDVLQFEMLASHEEPQDSPDEANAQDEDKEESLPPISEAELNQFIHDDLDRLDNVDYFKKHLE